MSTIEQSWNKLFNYWKIIKSKPYCKGASEEEINKLKNGLKLKLPQPFIDSLKICNGEKLEINYKIKYSEKIKKNPYQTISLGIIRTFDIDKILEMRYVGDETPEEWIPLAYWSGDYQAILDIRKETFGQVLFGIVEDDLFLVWASSYEKWLEIMVNEVIEYGVVREELLENIYKDKNRKQLKYPDYL